MEEIKAYCQEYIKINSIDELLDRIYNFYYDCCFRLPNRKLIINYLQHAINNNSYFYKNKIKIVKINFNDIFQFKQEYYYFEDDIKNQILAYLKNKEINIPKEINKKFRKIKSKNNNQIDLNDMSIRYFVNINKNIIFINIINCYSDLLINNNYQIDLNNNKLKIFQQIDNQTSITDFLNCKLSLKNFKFILHKDNILIGYKGI